MHLFNFHSKLIDSAPHTLPDRDCAAYKASFISYTQNEFQKYYPKQQNMCPGIVIFYTNKPGKREEQADEFYNYLNNAKNFVPFEIVNDKEDDVILLFSQNLHSTINAISEPRERTGPFDPYWIDLLSIRISQKEELKTVSNAYKKPMQS